VKPTDQDRDTLAWRLRLTMERRTRLRITSIGAIDVRKEDRPAYLREHHRRRKEDERRANGVKPRTEYLAAVKAKEPWVALGISRATWYRRGKPGLETGPQTRKKERQRYAAPRLTDHPPQVAPKRWRSRAKAKD